MKKIKLFLYIVIVSFGMFLLIMNWSLYKELPYELFDKIFRSRYERSLEQDNIKIKNEPNNPWAYIDRGETYKKNKKYLEALKDFQKAYELKDSYFIVLDDISNIYLAIGNTKKAYEYIHKLLRIAPYPENFLFDLAIIYDYECKSQDSIVTYSKFINNTDKNKFENIKRFSRKRRAVHYILLKEYYKAKEDVQILLRENPDDKDAKKLEDLLSDTSNLNSSNIREEFKMDVYEAIVGTTKI